MGRLSISNIYISQSYVYPTSSDLTKNSRFVTCIHLHPPQAEIYLSFGGGSGGRNSNVCTVVKVKSEAEEYRCCVRGHIFIYALVWWVAADVIKVSSHGAEFPSTPPRIYVTVTDKRREVLHSGNFSSTRHVVLVE